MYQLPEAFVTSDNREIYLRYITAADAALLVDMFYHLSDRTRQLRFHSYMGKVSEKQVWATAMALSNLEPERQVAIVALSDTGDDDGKQHAIGVARFSRKQATDTTAEAAIVVRDDFQNNGIGGFLLLQLIYAARSMGITHFLAWIMQENRHMLSMLHKFKLPVEQKRYQGEVEVLVDLTAMEQLFGSA